MKARNSGYIALIVTLLMLVNLSCTEIVDIELDSTYTRLVVDGKVSDDSVKHQVLLTLSSDYFSNQAAPRVSDAMVYLEFEDVILQMEEHDTIPGLYQTPYAFPGVIGTTYSLSINQVDVDKNGTYESYHASSTMPGGVVFDSILLNYSSTPFGSGYEVYMFALDPPSDDWYGFNFWKNSDLITPLLSDYNIQNDDFYNGKYLFYGIPVGYFSDDETEEQLFPGDTVTLELHSIDRAYYEFVGDSQLELFGNNPLFSGPPADIRSNIDNGGTGAFNAYSITRASAIVSEKK